MPVDEDGRRHSDRPRDVNGVTLQPGQDVNPTPPAATGVQVAWRDGHGLPGRPHHEPRLHRLRAIEAVCDTPLPVHESAGGYRVDLPAFQFMALLVVTEPDPPEPLPRAAGDSTA